MTGRIASRNGRPAYENAPPRLRASRIERPQPTKPRSLWQRIFGGR